MKYVLDASTGLKWVLPEPLADKARQLREDYRNGAHELLAPDFFDVEVAHALARAERRKIIPVGECGKTAGRHHDTAPQFHPHRPLLARALDLASQMRIGVYDCVYLALAEREGCEFVTADDRLVNEGRPTRRFWSAVGIRSTPA
jgi:predicted nucleic acid-binding protein